MPHTSIVTVGLLFILGAASAAAGPCTDEIDRLTKEMAARDAGSGPTPGAQAQPGQAQTEGRAASPQDMQRRTAAMEAFNRALMLDQQGNESGCMSAIEEIRRLSSE